MSKSVWESKSETECEGMRNKDNDNANNIDAVIVVVDQKAVSIQSLLLPRLLSHTNTHIC